MSFPSGALLDNFNRANGTPGANWSLAHAFAGSTLFLINTNLAAPGGDYVVSAWNASTYGPDAEAWMTVSTRTNIANDGPYLLVRMQQLGTGTLDGYSLACEQNGAGWKMARVDNGVWTQLGATVNAGITNGDKYGIEVIGTTLTAWRKAGAAAWASQFTRTDATYGSAGYIGLYIGNDDTNQRYDDFGGGVALAPSTSLCMPTAAQRMRHLMVR